MPVLVFLRLREDSLALIEIPEMRQIKYKPAAIDVGATAGSARRIYLVSHTAFEKHSCHWLRPDSFVINSRRTTI